jgi:integrase
LEQGRIRQANDEGYQIRLALSVLEPRERVIFKLAVLLGLRPGEILALRVGKISVQLDSD